MLNDKDASANIAVKDLEMARKFYGETLGLKQIDSIGDEVAVFGSGSSKLVVYRSQYAGTNQATAVTWSVGENIEAIVHALKTKDIKFEHYDLPNVRLEGYLHVAGKMKVAWFKDPDGNILNILNE
ncbi:MAG: VOC family protein [Nitrosopumilus sp.]|nr:VOC family protein [Nitrosopumilus sp.]